MDTTFWKDKKVLITGHTGFKGSWLCLTLQQLGANVFGYALEPPTEPSLYKICNLDSFVQSTIADIRDCDTLYKTIETIKPEIIIHMAAQPLVRESYKNPVETYQINVMGTVQLLEAVRQIGGVKAFVNVTTDKCYENKEWPWGYRENEPMGGYDPYSNSKGCSELVTSSFRNSFFNAATYSQHGLALASGRAGNVIGGGDWATDRLIPDIIKAISLGEKVQIRSPFAIRPWQHVLEPLTGYLTLAEKLYTEGPKFAEGWNFGPMDEDAKPVEWIVRKLCTKWGNGASFEIDKNPQPHEATYLKLDCSKARQQLNWNPRWRLERTLDSIVEFTKAYQKKDNIQEICNKQIAEYLQTKIE
jgi:CDP-glucose 4,6-dehydratase